MDKKLERLEKAVEDTEAAYPADVAAYATYTAWSKTRLALSEAIEEQQNND
jgi:hypothetical protein